MIKMENTTSNDQREFLDVSCVNDFYFDTGDVVLAVPTKSLKTGCEIAFLSAW